MFISLTGAHEYCFNEFMSKQELWQLAAYCYICNACTVAVLYEVCLCPQNEPFRYSHSIKCMCTYIHVHATTATHPNQDMQWHSQQVSLLIFNSHFSHQVHVAVSTLRQVLRGSLHIQYVKAKMVDIRDVFFNSNQKLHKYCVANGLPPFNTLHKHKFTPCMLTKNCCFPSLTRGSLRNEQLLLI